MDWLKWDSDVYDQYISNLRKLHQKLDDEYQALFRARKGILKQAVAGDEAMASILTQLDKAVKRLNALDDRVCHLMEALMNSEDILRSAENRVANLGNSLLYSVVTRQSKKNLGQPLYQVFSSQARGMITPDWLSNMAYESGIQPTQDVL